jgi:hypothetical protein
MMMVAGEAALAVSLADSLFLSISPDAARSKVLLFLAFSFAPFVVLSKVISPYLDQLPGGRRMTVFLVGVLRAIVVLAMIRYLQSYLLFPLAFASLILAKVYQVSRSAMTPTVVADDDALMSANGRFGRLTGIVGLVAGGPAVLLQRIHPDLSLVMSAGAFVLAAVLTLKLPRHVAAVTSKASRKEREEMGAPEIIRAGFAMSSLRATSGFMMLHLAFWLRNEKAGLAWFALALAVASASTLLANSVGASLTRKLNHHAILFSSLLVIAIVGVISALVGSITAGIVLAGVVNGFGAVGKLAFDSIVQRHAPDANRSRVFAQYETRNQLFQVAGGLMAVLLVPSGAVGFACVGAYAAFTTAYYGFKY